MSELPDPTTAVLADISAERMRQDERWGVQNLPFGTGPLSTPLQPYASHKATLVEQTFRQRTDINTENGTLTFIDVLLEEVFEAAAESDPQRLRDELVQVAAVAVKTVEAIDRQSVAGSVTAHTD